MPRKRAFYSDYANDEIKMEVRLDQLTDEHVEEIRNAYLTTGLPHDDRFLTEDAGWIRSQMKHVDDVFFRLTLAGDIGKLCFSEKVDVGDGQRYLHITVGANRNVNWKKQYGFELQDKINEFYASIPSFRVEGHH